MPAPRGICAQKNAGESVMTDNLIYSPEKFLTSV